MDGETVITGATVITAVKDIYPTLLWYRVRESRCKVQFSNMVFRHSFCSPPSFVVHLQTLEKVKGPVFKYLIHCRVLLMSNRPGGEYVHVSKACFQLSK